MSTYSPAQRRRILFAAITASSMGFIDGSVISIVTAAIRATLDASLADVQWVSNAYLLTLSSLLLLGGAAGDRFGLRNVFAAGIVLFVIASMASAFAASPAMLIAARAVQGLGAAFMVPGSLAIIAEAYPKEERGGAIGTWAAASSLTTLLGPVLGGALLTWFGDNSWRWVFAINLPLGAIALALLFGTPSSTKKERKPLDIVGALLATPMLFLLSWAFIDSSGWFWAYLGAGLVVLLLFLWWEQRASAPMLPLALFADPRFSGAQAVTFLIYFALSAVLFYLPMVMIAGWFVSPAEVALSMLPFGIVLTILSPLAGKLTDRLGPGPVIAAGGFLVTLAIVALGLTAPLHQVWFAVVPILTLFGIGMSGVAGPISTAVMGAVSEGETGTASAINNAVARVAGLIAIASMGGLAVFVFTLGGSDATGFGVVPEDATSGALEAMRVAATDRSFAAVCFATSALALLGSILSWLLLERRPPAVPRSGAKSEADATP
ncbi:MFS transporter [Devosia rhizoryzae]|uniref:MFS transporter n=1 Tax=Devosia rhizoryzae TaxID=2774137 RepID=A0ABX7C9T0_9HYPH|nr:MFS transporter [Devosia rhizoryzae]QQR40019.1 MFS transporter [Devosia rhizoryzae]